MKLVWLDLETTGLDPQRDLILEIAVSVSDSASPFEAEPVFHRVFPHAWWKGDPPPHINPFVVDMHTRNGLWAECAMAMTHNEPVVADADDELTTLALEWYQQPDDPPILAGSTIHFDRSFLKVHMPVFERRFSHRHFDISSIKMFAAMLGMPKPPKVEAHRAREDVLESIRAGKAITQWVVDKVTRVR